MYVEFACYDVALEDDVKQQVFKALDLGANGISVPSVFLPSIANFMPEGISVSCPIDYPSGRAETKVRNHAVLKAIHRGANAVDLVAHIVFLLNNKINEFIEDLGSAQKICEAKGVTLRVMLDYRLMDEAIFTEACAALKTMGIDYAFASTGHLVDDYEENVLLCYELQSKYEIFAIANGNIFLPKHQKLAEEAEIFGVRFHKINALERCAVGV